MKILKIFILCQVLLISACGFHPRHMHANIAKHYPIIVFTPSGSITFSQTLIRVLRAQSIEVLDEQPDNADYPVLRITSELLTTFPLVYGPDSELRRERLTFTVSFSFGLPPKKFTLMTQRDRQLSSMQLLGDNDEKILIEQEMQIEIIDQLLRYLDALNRNT